MQRLAAFGSVLTAAFNDESDIDFIVTFELMPLEEYADNYLGLKDALEALFHRPVDQQPWARRSIKSFLIYSS